MTSYEIHQLFKNQLAIMQVLAGSSLCTVSNQATFEQRIEETTKLIELIDGQRKMGRQ